MTATVLERRRRLAEWMTVTLVIACIVTLGFAAFVVSPGHYGIDEIAYHLMVRELWTWGRFDVLNGYQEVPSAAYVWPVTVVHDGRLVPQYPAIHSFIALPFYALAGYRGLFVLNACAFCGTVWLVYAIARQLTPERIVALAAGLIYVFATFAWDYAAAAWPHALATLFVTGAVYLALRALLTTRRREAIGWAFGAGLVAGFGVGVRIDVVFVMAALILPLLFVRPVRFMAAVAVCLGAIPGLAVIAWINHIRYGIASPFTYGRDPSGSATDPLSYLPLAALGLVGAAGLWLCMHPRGQAFIRRYRRPLAAAGLIGSAVLIPVFWDLLARLADGTFQLVVDMRVRDLSIAESGLSRGPGGGMVYLGMLKKSLLQSCPYLVILIIPMAMVVSGRRNALPLAMILLVPAAFVGAYGYFAWHGGQSLNMRYFTPILPATSVLAAIGYRALRQRAAGGYALVRRCAVVAALALIAGVAAFAPISDDSMRREEFLILTVPLIIAGVSFAAIALSFAGNLKLRMIGARGALAMMPIGLVWAGMVTFAYDVPTDWAKRAFAVSLAEAAEPAIAPHALLMVRRLSLFAPLYERRDINMVEPRLDDFASFRRLIDYHLKAGRPVYAALAPMSWATLAERDLLRDVTMTRLPIDTSFEIVRIERRERPGLAGPDPAREAPGKGVQSGALPAADR